MLCHKLTSDKNKPNIYQAIYHKNVAHAPQSVCKDVQCIQRYTKIYILCLATYPRAATERWGGYAEAQFRSLPRPVHAHAEMPYSRDPCNLVCFEVLRKQTTLQLVRLDVHGLSSTRDRHTISPPPSASEPKMRQREFASSGRDWRLKITTMSSTAKHWVSVRTSEAFEVKAGVEVARCGLRSREVCAFKTRPGDGTKTEASGSSGRGAGCGNTSRI